MYVELEVEAGNASSFCNQAARLKGVCYTDVGEHNQDKPILTLASCHDLSRNI